MREPARRSLFRQRNFTRLWWGQLFSITGDRFTYLALTGLLFEHSRETGASGYGALLAVLANVVVAPVLLFAPFTGAWIDRLDLKRVLVVADALRALIVLAIPPVYHLSGEASAVFLMVFLLFTVNVVFLPAKSALVPEIVPSDQLLAANSLLAIAGVVATGIGALVGGFVIDRWGWAIAMQLDALSYFISVVTLALIVYRPRLDHGRRPPVTVRRYLSEVTEGWRLLRNNSVVAVGIVALGAVWFAGGVLHVAGNERIQAAASSPGMQRLGALLFAIGVGSALGAWWINTRGRHISRPLVLGSALVLTGLSIVPFATSSLFAVFLVAAFLAGICIAPVLVLSETVMQEGTQLEHRARVFSARDFLMRFTLLATVSVTAWFANLTSASRSLIVCSIVLIGLGAATLVHARRAPREPAGLDLTVSAPTSGSSPRQ
jgi:MFS family permease